MSLNILFINSLMIYGGGEIWMITAAKELIKRDHNLTLVCPPGSQLEKYAEKNNINFISLRIKGELDPLTIYKLVRIINKNKIDIILTNMDKETRLCGFASIFSRKVKIVARRGIDFPIKNKIHYRLTYNRFIDIVVANSEATKRTLLRNAHWLNPERIKVIYNGIDIENYTEEKTKDLRYELGIDKDIPLLGFVGRLSPQKGIEYLLKSFAEVKKRTNANLIIAGTGGLEKFVRDFIFKEKLEKSVFLLGFREDVNNIMRTIDLLILPSLWEGFGIVLIEAMAAEKPCVTFQISSMPEIVENNISGIVVPAKDTDAITEACIKIISNKPLAKKMGKEGKRIADEKFGLKEMVDNYENVFKEVLKKN